MAEKVLLDTAGRKRFLFLLPCFASRILSNTDIQPLISVSHYQLRRQASEGA